MRISVIKTGLLCSMLGVLLVSAALAGAKPAAATFSLPDQTGASVSLNDFAGQVVLLNFWASWCGPCREEMPLLDELHKRYAPVGFTMLGINVEEDSAAAKHFLGATPVDFPILFDSANKVSKLYDVIAMPSTVIIGRDGAIKYIHHGYESGDESVYQDEIRKALRE